ncbi:MAG: DNA polymerase IV [Planctomycetota bacterium]
MPSPYDARLTIIHADMDAFYAAIEVLDDPRLRGLPVIVGYPGARGVVATASYEARRFGVRSAMPSTEAMRRCPAAVWRPGRMERYAEVSRQIQAIFGHYTPEIEPLSLDEAFLDVTNSLALFGGAEAIARTIHARVRSETGGLTVSLGVAENKFLAKLASDFRKPAGLTVVTPETALDFLAPLAIEKLWGVGAKTAPRLHALGLKTIGDARRAGAKVLTQALGARLGAALFELANGRDERSVETRRDARSISSETTFMADLRELEQMRDFLFEAAENVATALRRARLRARCVELKVRTGDFQTVTRQKRLAQSTELARPLYEGATQLLAERIALRGRGVRLLGLAAKDLEPAAQPQQLELFETPDSAVSRITTDLADRIVALHGKDAVVRARQLETPESSRRAKRNIAFEPRREIRNE